MRRANLDSRLLMWDLHADWVSLAKSAQPGPESTAKSMINRTLVGRAVLATVDAAMDVAGGAAFFRVNGLERLFRDAQGARYHPLQEGLQKALAARAAHGDGDLTSIIR